jgi:hypothetical protein
MMTFWVVTTRGLAGRGRYCLHLRPWNLMRQLSNYYQLTCTKPLRVSVSVSYNKIFTAVRTLPDIAPCRKVCNFYYFNYTEEILRRIFTL